MNNRKKRGLTIVLVVSMLMMVACGNKQEANSAPTNTSTETEESSFVSESTEEPIITETLTPKPEPSEPEQTEEPTVTETPESETPEDPTVTETPMPEPAPEPTPEPHIHSYKESVTKEATCTDKGTKTFLCDCGDSYTKTIRATGHNYEVVANSKVFATCTNNGKESDRKCSFCGDVIEGVSIPKIPHSYGEYVYNKDATTEKDGTETATCGNCGNKDTRTIAGTRIEICPYELYTMAYDNQGYPYFYGKWGGSANMDADNLAKTEACIDQMGEYMRDNYSIWREDFDAVGVSFDYSWQLIGRYEGMEIVVRYVESCNGTFLDSPEERGIPTAGNGVWYEE